MTPHQSRAGRGLLDLKQSELAVAASLGVSTVIDFERSRRPVSDKARQAIQDALEAAGVIFVAENGEGPGVRLRKGFTPAARTAPSPEDATARAEDARSQAGRAADQAMSGSDASDEEKTERRNRLTAVPESVKRARGTTAKGD